jgi:hypothetical protein
VESLTIAWVALAAVLSICLSAVAIALIRRRRPVPDELPDVVELAHELAALKKQVRRAYMSSVREGPGSSPQHPLPLSSPPELQTPEPPPASSQALKQRLRDAVFSPRGNRH